MLYTSSQAATNSDSDTTFERLSAHCVCAYHALFSPTSLLLMVEFEPSNVDQFKLNCPLCWRRLKAQPVAVASSEHQTTQACALHLPLSSKLRPFLVILIYMQLLPWSEQHSAVFLLIYDTLWTPVLLWLITTREICKHFFGEFYQTGRVQEPVRLPMKLEGGRSLERMNAYGKKQCRSLFWRARAALKKAMKNGSKRQLKFQYDPSSYALNFDDGHNKMGEDSDAFKFELQYCGSAYNSAMWVYVLWVKSEWWWFRLCSVLQIG